MRSVAIAIVCAYAATAAAQAPPVRAIGVGEHFACALLESGDVRCWGNGNPKPTSIGLSGLTALGVGPEHACAARHDGVWCWGGNRDGKLGDGTTTDRATPVKISTLADIVELVAAEHMTCARTAAGAVYCWGNADCVGHRTGSSLTPGRVALPPATRLVAGDATTCAFLDHAPPRCWGFYNAGLLGDRSGPEIEPVASPVLAHADALAIGDRHACIAQSGSVWCAGEDQFGQLGDQWVPDGAQCFGADKTITCRWRDPVRATPVPSIPPPGDPPTPPQPPLSEKQFAPRLGYTAAKLEPRAKPTGLAAGNGRTCAITADSTVLCWGQWYLDDWAHHIPHEIAGTKGAVAVAVTEYFGCALLADHSVRCWGSNESGELGNGSIATSLMPSNTAEPVRW